MATTGRGHDPNLSAWAFNGLDRGLARTIVSWEARDQANKVVWQDWFFEAPPSPPSGGGGIKRLMVGVGL